MGLYVVTGAANAGKTGAIHTAVRTATSHRETAVLLLPSVPDVRRAQKELSIECAVGLSVSAFDPFLDMLWNQLCEGRSIVSRTQRPLLIHKAVARARLDVLGESSQRPGFARLLEDLVVRAAEGDALRGLPVSESGAGGEILRILAAYAVLLSEENLIEQAEAHGVVSARVDEIELPSVIAVNRFGSLTLQQERFLCAAAPYSEVWIGLTWVKDAPATTSAEALVHRLARIGTLMAVPLSPPAEDTPVELTMLERAYLMLESGPEHAVTPSGAVILSEAWGAEAEAARIAREVQDALADGVVPGEVAVVFRDPLRHVDGIRSAFKDVGIAAEYDLYMLVSSTGYGRALGQLLSFFCVGGERRDLIGFLRTPYVDVAHDRLDEFDARMRRARVSETGKLLASARQVDPRVAETLQRAERLCGRKVTTKTLPEWRRLMIDMISVAYGQAPHLDASGLIDARAMGLVFDAITEMASIETAEFRARDILAWLKDAHVAVFSQERIDSVQVLGAERMRGRRFSRVILGGLTATEFPSLPLEDALTATVVSSKLRRHDIDVSPRVDIDAERLLFYQVITRARHKLVLSRCVSDEEGRPLRPSPLLEELLDLYRDAAKGEDAWYGAALPVRVVTLSDLATSIDAPTTERRRLRQVLAENGKSNDVSIEPRVLLARWRNRARAACLGDAIAEGLAAQTVYSVSDIELYLACPYRWYVDRVLRPESLDAGLDASVTGRAAHEIMSRFYRSYEEQTGERRITPATLQTALSIHAVVADEVRASVRAVGLAEESKVRKLVRATRRLVEEDASLLEDFVPTAHEWSFGLGDDEPEDLGTFALRGRVDRIDVGSGGFIITDYKSGSVSGKQMARFADEGLVQLPLYAEVVRRRLDFGRPVGGFYRSILSIGKPRGFFREEELDVSRFSRTDRCSEEQVLELIADAVARASVAVEGMRAGRIDQNPNQKRCPTYCSARVYCEGRG
ncbi:MAG: PD-(D/E)XK nuclease family protein [Coriobacteriia bacterium]|nr:PD-(D/E)XK nuclease family protein [Coriobacteriia bacterium]